MTYKKKSNKTFIPIFIITRNIFFTMIIFPFTRQKQNALLKAKICFLFLLFFNVIALLLLVLFSSFLSPPTFYTQTFPFQQEFDLDIMLPNNIFFCLVLLLLTPPRVSQQYQYFFFMHSFIFSIQHCASNDYSYLINLFSHSILINNFAFSSLIFNFILFLLHFLFCLKTWM